MIIKHRPDNPTPAKASLAELRTAAFIFDAPSLFFIGDQMQSKS